MGTPFIKFLEPSKLDAYVRGKPHGEQPASIPGTFIDAMEVREEVFVKEQAVPLENEFDADDGRACHWVVYASINKTEEPEIRAEDGELIQARRSSTRTTPIGTLRLVPFPHDPHPEKGGRYWDGILEGSEDKPQSNNEALLSKPFIIDRPTTFHDGKEPYVKLGRLAVVKEFRGHRIAGLLVKTALDWLEKNPSFFNLSIKEMGLDNVGAQTERDLPIWNGLICVHAQEQVERAWAKWGFEIDEGMGKWYEEDIPHVGMFQRLEISPQPIRI